MPKYDFKFGQFWLSEFGAVSAEEPSMEIAQRDVTFISIPGKDGKDCIDNKRYDNVEFKRKIAFVGNRDFNVREKEHSLINSYAYLQGYQDFEDVPSQRLSLLSTNARFPLLRVTPLHSGLPKMLLTPKAIPPLDRSRSTHSS